MFIYMFILQVGWTKNWRAKEAVRHIFTFKNIDLNIYSAISCLLEGRPLSYSSFARPLGVKSASKCHLEFTARLHIHQYLRSWHEWFWNIWKLTTKKVELWTSQQLPGKVTNLTLHCVVWEGCLQNSTICQPTITANLKSYTYNQHTF